VVVNVSKKQTVIRCRGVHLAALSMRRHARKGGDPYLTGCAVVLGCSIGVPRPGE
jgi:hypothetical protein